MGQPGSTATLNALTPLLSSGIAADPRLMKNFDVTIYTIARTSGEVRWSGPLPNSANDAGRGREAGASGTTSRVYIVYTILYPI